MSKKLQLILAFVFGVTFVIVILVIAIVDPNPTPFRYNVFWSVLALAAAGVAAVIPGFLKVKFAGWLSAGGALGVFAIVYFFTPAKPVGPDPLPDSSPAISFTDMPPRIIGLYPKDLFGPAQQDGLKKGVAHYCSSRDVGVIDLNELSYSDLKDRNIDSLKSRLGEILARQNVLAISGPSITEITRDILEINLKTSRSPIFIASAAPEKLLLWKEFRKEMPLYRISTGIDRRGREISGFLDAVLRKGRKVHFLVERGAGSEPSFGKLFLEEIAGSYASFWSNTSKGGIRITEYDRGNLLGAGGNTKSILEESDILFFLGVGSDYRDIVNQMYSMSGAAGGARRPVLISWMHAHSIEEDFKKGPYFYDRVIEITDFDLSAYSIPPDTHHVFTHNFGAITPAKRDHAFSFDAAVIICEAYDKLVKSIEVPVGKYIKFDGVAISRLKDAIESLHVEGVTGTVGFNNLGENPTGKLIFTRYESSGEWNVVNPEKLLSQI